MTKIKVPKPFGKIIKVLRVKKVLSAYGDKSYVNEGVGDIRTLLGISKSDVCCDFYCVVEYDNNKTEGLLFEDKGRPNKLGKHVSDAITQIGDTHNLLVDKEKPVDKIFLTNCKIPREKKRILGTKRYKEYGFRILITKFPKESMIKIGSQPIFMFG